ncbi:Pkinase-domain-containing protein [Nemania abortiva]|nr:Pkinase-domain-containing protein [Nemania abortiva]
MPVSRHSSPMEPDEDSQATQAATQNAFDPRRAGQQNSGFSDQDISDIICVLYPLSEPASHEVQKIASSPEYAQHIAGRYSADAIGSDLYREDDAREFGRTRGIGDHALVLRLSSDLKDPHQGFTFGRNRERCDISFTFDPGKRLSNIHFRIYVNSYGSVLLEDQSTNGTVVDNKLLRRGTDTNNDRHRKRTLESGSTIKIVMHESKWDLIFLVRIPRREGEYEDAYMRNVGPYLLRLNGVDDVNKTIGPGPTGHVHLFAPTKGVTRNNQVGRTQNPQKPLNRLPREWRGGEKYNRVKVLGKGAFATVHLVTAKWDGSPYAAKELDKRKFMKNGVLDQKVENEMKIMQKVNHPNIVQYIEHFDWDAHQFIIIMEYVPGGDLGKLIQDHGPITEQHVKTIATQLVDALGYLHDNKITHRDVKPDNILIHSTDPLVVKLTDFGLSKMIDTEQTFLKTFCGTLLYCAPEVYTEYPSYDDYGQRTNRRSHRPVDRERYGHAVDIWSLGGVLFYTLTGSPPFPVKNGTTYTELLDHIVKTPMNITPLARYNVSDYGIHFLSRMIHVRPETRATIAELKSHGWLNPSSSSVSESNVDENLRQSASQLSLDDSQSPQITSIGSSSPREPEPDFSMDFESQENNTFGQPQAPRLFGEVSAIGSSGVIPEERLNLPISDTSFGDTERYGSEVGDSFDDSDDFSTPREVFRQNQNNVSALHGSSPQDNSRSALLGIGSQSLGGASSILKNLNMKSPATTNLSLTSSRISNLATSKRKPDDNASDEYDTPNANAAPSLKRLKSEGNVDILADEDALIAAIPPLGKTNRQIDLPLSKQTYWASHDDKTWHLNYPEMTSLQYHAFQRAAEKRNETFEPGTPLWSVAMKYFPPSHRKNTARTLALRPKISNYDGNPTRKPTDPDLPSTALIETLDNQFNSQLEISASQENSPSATLSASVTVYHSRIEVGVFKSTPTSLVLGISIPVDDPVLSWGREASNTVVYRPATQAMVPKNAFRVMLWKNGYLSSANDKLRPWETAHSGSSTTMRSLSEQPLPGSSTEPDSYAFYIATKATSGIRINGVPLNSHEPKNATTVCKYWMKLYNGDHIAFWGGSDPSAQAELVFECSWGGSSITRPGDKPPTCEPRDIARRLDSLWPVAVKLARRSRLNEEGQIDTEMRMQNMLREHERSRRFEQRRVEAVRRVAQRQPLKTPPTDDGPERARTGPPTHQFALPGRFQSGR